MIILEGPDNAGKSTLGGRLSKLTGLPLIHSTRPQGFSEEDMKIHSMRQLSPKLEILDRVFAIGEYVYSRALGRESALGSHRDCFMDLLHRPYLIIYCRPPVNNIRASSKAEMAGVRENIDQIILEYDVVMKELGIMTCGELIHYDWTKDKFLPLLEKCLDHLEKDRSRLHSAEFLSQFSHNVIPPGTSGVVNKPLPFILSKKESKCL